MCETKCVKLKLENWLTEVFFPGFDLPPWANLLNLIGHQHLMLARFHWLFYHIKGVNVYSNEGLVA